MTRSFERLIQYLAFVAITVDMMILAALFRLRWTQPGVTRPYPTPGYPWLPLITVGLYIALFVIVATQQTDLAIGGAFMVLLLPLGGHLWLTRWGERPTMPEASSPSDDDSPIDPEREDG